MDFNAIIETITALFADFDINAVLDAIMGLVGGLIG
mgnify:FL=1